ncbi:MAG: hypothetical protein U0J65_01475 [Christensenellales bacterium]|nr:hypothetical protein [Christensenellales bacterium]
MDVLTGLALFGGGVAAGAYLMVSYYGALKNVQESERRAAERSMEQAKRYNEAMQAELASKARSLRSMESKREREASWCDGFEAGMREAMRGVTIGDVVTITRLHNARRVRSTND